MPSGSDSAERARADRLREEFEKNRRERDITNERIKIRAELKSVSDEEPDTGVVHVEAAKRMTSEPPKAGPIQVIVIMARKFPPWGAVIVALAAIAAYVALHLLK